MNSLAINSQRLKSNLAKMINIYSPSGKEGELLDYLTEYLASFDLSPKQQRVDKRRYNLIVKGSGEKNKVLFIGHLDTISAFSLKDYGFSQDKKGVISGLGSVDMKSGCAAMLESFLTFKEKTGSLPPADLALVVGEEDWGDGVLRFVKDYFYPWAIVAEPTNLKPCLSHYGYLECEFHSYGVRRHASFGSKGHNAVYSMLNLLLFFRDYFKDKYTYNIRDLHSSDAGFSVPDSCVCWLDIHAPAKVDLGVLQEDIIKVVENFHQKRSKTKINVTFPTLHKGYKISHKEPIVDWLKKAYRENNLRWALDRFSSDSDASVLNASGIKPVIVGPGSLAKAHTENEAVEFKQVVKASEIYLSVLTSL